MKFLKKLGLKWQCWNRTHWTWDDIVGIEGGLWKCKRCGQLLHQNMWLPKNLLLPVKIVIDERGYPKLEAE